MAAHVLVAALLGLGVFSATAVAHPRRPFRLAFGAPTKDPGRSWAYGAHRGHEVLLGFTREQPSAQVNQWDMAATQLFRHLTTADMDRLLCWVRMPSLLLGLEVSAPPEGPSNAAITGRRDVDQRLAVHALAHTWAVDAGIRIAERLARTRATLPPLPWEQSTAAALEALARARSLQFDRTHLAVTGTHGDLGLSVALTTSPPLYGNPSAGLGYAIGITARYASLGAGLRVFPERGIPGLTKMFLKDAKLGDPIFDDAFIVQADAPTALAWIFTPEVRARLVTMVARSTSVSVDDTQVTMQLGAQTVEPVSLGYALEDVVGTAHALVRARASSARRA